MDDDDFFTCGASAEDGCSCTLVEEHDGPHQAFGLSGPLHIWV